MRWLPVLWAAPAALAGGGCGLAALAVHRHALWVAGWPLPWGAALAVVAPAALCVVLRGLVAPLVGFVLGWAAVLLAALSDGPGGDFVLLADAVGWGFVGTSAVLMGLALVVGLSRRRDAATQARAGGAV